MPVYNETLDELQDSISSIQKQTYKQFEFIIIDDNPSSKEIKQFLYKKSVDDTRIKLIFNKRNMGAIASANKGIYAAKGRFIARMDADDIAVPNRLYSQLRFTLKNDLDISCCNYRSFQDIKHIKKINDYCNITQIRQDKIKRVMSVVNIAIGPTLFFKRDAIHITGVYRNVLAEDYDLSTRFLVNNLKLGYLSTPLIYKRTRLDSLSNVHSLKIYVILKSISRYLRKNKFNKVIPISYINKNIRCNIKKIDIKCYHNFIINKIRFNKHKSLKNLLYKYLSIFPSILLFKEKIYMHFYRCMQTFLIR